MLNYDLVTCIITCHNQFNTAFNTIRSVLLQNYNNIELIFADDGSLNFDKKKIIEYINFKKNKNITNIHVFAHKKNIGTVKNLNYAIQYSNGKYIIVVHSDDELYDKDVVSKIVNRFRITNANIVSCSRMMYDFNTNSEMGLLPDKAFYKSINKWDSGIKQFKHFANGHYLDFASGSALYYKKDFFNNIGCFDEEYDLFEDGPFIAKVTRNNIKIATAYDIISIKYRCNGISSLKKEKVPIRIYKDYCKIYDKEFLHYKNMFNFLEYRIINGRKEITKKLYKNRWYLFLIYPEAFINNIFIRFEKFFLKYLYKLGVNV